ncbi:hypothetical protein HZC53_01405 [Candidatus Uhrbacteria bacterium]|nr:hypothetical protein [Candidatus Uhrbacteria bacterium]
MSMFNAGNLKPQALRVLRSRKFKTLVVLKVASSLVLAAVGYTLSLS